MVVAEARDELPRDRPAGARVEPPPHADDDQDRDGRRRPPEPPALAARQREARAPAPGRPAGPRLASAVPCAPWPSSPRPSATCAAALPTPVHGGSAWESNPPRACLEPDTGFEVREAHRDPMRFRSGKSSESSVSPRTARRGPAPSRGRAPARHVGPRPARVRRPVGPLAADQGREDVHDVAGSEPRRRLDVAAVHEEEPRDLVGNPEPAEKVPDGRALRQLDAGRARRGRPAARSRPDSRRGGPRPPRAPERGGGVRRRRSSAAPRPPT